MRRLVLAGSCAIYALLTIITTPALAAPYGSGSYGDCSYQTGCSTPAPSPKPPVPSTPEPAPVPPQVVINTPGLVDGQTITESPFTVVVDITATDGAGAATTPPEIGWVVFYIDDRLIGTIYSPEGDGTYQYEWNVRKNPGDMLSIVVYNKDGSIIGRRDIPVRIALTPLPVASNNGEPAVSDEGPGIGAIGRLIHQTPPIVAKSFPYWIFIALLILAIRFIWQAIRETVGNNTMQALLARQQLIADEKDNFIALSSHYLHTPLTVIRNGAETMVATMEATKESLEPLFAAVEKLKGQIDTILGQVEGNSVLGSIKSPTVSGYTASTLRSPFFWMPVVAVGAICVVANILFGLVGEIDLGTNNLLTQLILFALVVVFFFLAFRSHSLRKREHAKSKQLVDYQNAIDAARNTFIVQSTNALSSGLEEVGAAKSRLAQSPTKNYVDEGYNRFDDILTKFRLLGQLQTSAAVTGIETFPLKTALEGAVAQFKEQIEAKKLTVHVNTHNITVTQNPQLLSYVLRTVIDNAIKFSKEGGEIAVTASKASGSLEISIVDNGIGIPDDKLPSLFKPFSRAGSAIQFDYEGLGFSLFLDKIIMDYLDGDISATSDGNRGTIITVTA